MDDSLEFTDDEIRDELSKLGYHNVPHSQLAVFKKDLGRLIYNERSKLSSHETSLSSYCQPTDTSKSYTEPPPKSAPARGRVPRNESPEDIQTSDVPDESLQYAYSRGHDKDSRQFDRGLDPRDVRDGPRFPRGIDGDFSLEARDTDESRLSHRDDVSEADSERRMVKRKVLRKEKDGSKRIDESMSESDTGSLMNINARLRQLGIVDSVGMFEKQRPQSARTEPPYRLSENDPRPPSVILRKAEHPHTKNLKKTDPVDRYRQFRQSWDQQRAPGEKNHKNLRWNIREQMLAQDVVYEKKPHRVYIPNKFVIPSDKKRNTLRWQIRLDMAQGELPHHGVYQQY